MKFIEREVYMKILVMGHGSTRYMPYDEQLVLEIQDFMAGIGGNTFLLNTNKTQLLILPRNIMMNTSVYITTKTIIRLWGYRIW